MAQASEQITVALQGHVSVAPLGTQLPADLEELGEGFVDLGYTTEEGVTFTATPTVEDIGAWQSATPVRRLMTARNVSAAWQGLQWNLDTFALAFGGGEWTEPTAGVHRYDPPGDNDALSEYVCVIDFADGAKEARLVIKRGSVTDPVETNLVRNGAALLPVTFNGLSPNGDDTAWYLLGNDELIGEGS